MVLEKSPIEQLKELLLLYEKWYELHSKEEASKMIRSDLAMILKLK